MGRAFMALKRRDSAAAVEILRGFVHDCPVQDSSALSGAMYWLGLCLLRDRCRGPALRSLASAQRLMKRGFARSTYLRLSNGYGMPRLGSVQEDDRAAFYSIQLSRYLERRAKRSFCSECERDVVFTLIGDSWQALWQSRALDGKAEAQKLAIFKLVKIVFPMRAPDRSFFSATVHVDFTNGTECSPIGLCPCGSGLAYQRCCGRSASVFETERGFF